MPEDVSLPLVQAGLVGEAIDHGPAMVFVADEEMSFVAVNQYACDVLGYTRPGAVGGADHRRVALPGRRGSGSRSSWSTGRPTASRRLRRKDGTFVKTRFAAKQTTVAGLTLYVWVGFPETSA